MQWKVLIHHLPSQINFSLWCLYQLVSVPVFACISYKPGALGAALFDARSTIKKI